MRLVVGPQRLVPQYQLQQGSDRPRWLNRIRRVGLRNARYVARRLIPLAPLAATVVRRQSPIPALSGPFARLSAPRRGTTHQSTPRVVSRGVDFLNTVRGLD